MIKLPVISAEQLVKVLQKKGYALIRQRGSHLVLQKRESTLVITVVVPNYKEIAKGTLKAILRKTKLVAEDLQN